MDEGGARNSDKGANAGCPSSWWTAVSVERWEPMLVAVLRSQLKMQARSTASLECLPLDEIRRVAGVARVSKINIAVAAAISLSG